MNKATALHRADLGCGAACIWWHAVKASVIGLSGEHAPLRRHRNAHEARETYKTLKDQNIGNAATCAQLYADWAGLEAAAGERERALAILRKGLKAGAQPARCGVCVCGPPPASLSFSLARCAALHHAVPHDKAQGCWRAHACRSAACQGGEACMQRHA